MLTLWQFCLISWRELMVGEVELNCLEEEEEKAGANVLLKALLVGSALFAKNDI